jgi:hypothetical protein
MSREPNPGLLNPYTSPTFMCCPCKHFGGTYRSAVVAFLDFRKAYDTISRDFLYAAMDTVGVGHGFIAWVRLLLTSTTAVAVVNGFASHPTTMTAGVRQGCPLAPLLYLFIGQALLSWLKARGFGVEVALRVLTALQYADDTEAFLTSLQQVTPFLAAMQVFAAATGQHLNPDKVELMLVGELDAGATVPDQVEGLRVVRQAKTLGIIFSNDPQQPVTVDWPARLQRVDTDLDKLVRLHLSTFGRAFAAGGYALSKLLYHAEFGGMPDDSVMQHLTTSLNKVVDRCQTTSNTQHHLTGIPGSLLVGHPLAGGFGLLPVDEHIRARHAVWASRLVCSLLTSDPPKPWIAVAAALVTALAPPNTTLMALLTTRPQPHETTILGGAANLPTYEPLRRLLLALSYLPPVEDVGAEPLQPGPWCGYMPLWCNPLLGPGGRGLETCGFKDVFGCGNCRTLHDAVYHRLHTPLTYVSARFSALLDQIPLSWYFYYMTHDPAADPEAAEAAARQQLLQRLGWRLEGRIVLLQDLTVRTATLLQQQPLQVRRQVAHAGFLSEALTLPPHLCPTEQQHRQFFALLQHQWRLRWENSHKEVLWRLAVDGVPLLGNTHIRSTTSSCPCRRGGCNRLHHFWDCPVAQAVRQEVEAAASVGPISRSQLWLALTPAALHPGIWRIVSLAALTAMEKGRRKLWRLHYRNQELRPDPRQATLVG